MTTPTKEQIDEQNKQSLYDFIKKELEADPKKSAVKLAGQFCKDNAKTLDAKTLLKLAETYPTEKEEFARQARGANKFFVTTPENFLKRIKEYRPENNYFCNVFKQTDRTNQNAEPLKFPRGTLSYIGARTHRGKTTALISIALDAILQKQRVYFFTSEETQEQIITRMIKAIFYRFFARNEQTFKSVDGNSDLEAMIFNFLANYEPLSIQQTFDEQKELFALYNTAIIDNSQSTINAQQAVFFSYWILCDLMKRGYFAIIDGLQHRTFEELAESLKLLEAGSIVLLDYIQHLKNPTNAGVNNRQVIIQNESMEIADLAGLNDLIVIAGGQFNRKGSTVEKESDKYTPDLLDASLFRESGDIEQDAHIIIGLGQQADKDNPHAPKRFYEVLKQRGHEQDGNKYAIADNSKYSLFHCVESENGKTLDFFRPIEPPKKATKDETKHGNFI